VKKAPIAITYPFGEINGNQLVIVSKYYQIGFTTTSGVMSNGYSKHIIKRYQVNKGTNLDSLCNYLNTYKNMGEFFGIKYK